MFCRIFFFFSKTWTELGDSYFLDVLTLKNAKILTSLRSYVGVSKGVILKDWPALVNFRLCLLSK